MPVADSDATRESLSASSVSGSESDRAAFPHGALNTRPSNGRTKKATPIVANAITTIGTLCRLTWGSGVQEAEGLQRRLASRRENEGDERVGEVRVLGALDRDQRVSRDDVVRVRDCDAVDLTAGRFDVGRINDAGVGLAELDLAHHGLDVGLQTLGRDGHAGLRARLQRVRAGRERRRLSAAD